MRLRDRSAVDRAVATLAHEQIGRTRHRTPEGYLLCEGARVARTGSMMYTPDEMPDIEVGTFGRMITIMRDAEVLFAPETILSFAGKPITNDHPNENVSPSTYQSVAVGTVLNPRQGTGTEAQYLLADLLITDADAIEAVEADKVQLSPGYDCEVEQIKPGIGRQTFVLGNHVALVDQGRGGPHCSIQDSKETDMGKRTRSLADRLRAAFTAKDEAAFEKEIAGASEIMDDGEEDDGVQRLVIEVQQPGAAAAVVDTPPVDPNEVRFAGIETTLATLVDAIAALAPPAAEVVVDAVADEDASENEEDDKTVAMDAASKAEILAPGLRLPTFDTAKVKRSAITAVRRNALSTAYADAKRRPVIDSILGGRAADFSKMKSQDLATVFDAAAAVAAAANNGSRERTIDIPQGPMTAARYAEQIKARHKR